MSKSKYKQFHDHQEIEIKEGIGLNFACCDCALVHDLQIRRDGDKIFVSFTRNNRATAALRRRYDVPMQERVKQRKSDQTVWLCPRCGTTNVQTSKECWQCKKIRGT